MGNDERRPPFASLIAFGLLWGKRRPEIASSCYYCGMHLQHIVYDGGARHFGKTIFLPVLSLGLFVGSIWACHWEDKAE